MLSLEQPGMASESVAEGYYQLLAGLPDHLHHLLRLTGAHRHGPLTDHVLARLQNSHRHLRVEEIGSADGDGVNVQLQELRIVCEVFGNAIFFDDLPRPL